jgi:hypothetical protein
VEYNPHTNDKGEDCGAKKACYKIQKKIASKISIGREATGPVCIDLIANMEEQIEGEEDD